MSNELEIELDGYETLSIDSNGNLRVYDYKRCDITITPKFMEKLKEFIKERELEINQFKV